LSSSVWSDSISKQGGEMSKCKRNILLIFGYFIIMAILFVPYSKRDVPKPQPGFQLDQSLYTIPKRNGFILTPILISKIIKANKEIEISKEGIIKSKEKSNTINNFKEYAIVIGIYQLKLDFFFTEITLIFLTSGFAYILFCLVLRKSKKKGKNK
jgi:hypothetical protein